MRIIMICKAFCRAPVCLLAWIAAAALLVAAAPARAAGSDSAADDPILVQRGSVAVRKSDFDAEIQRIPEKDRSAFLYSLKRVRELINNMMLAQELADAAKARGVDKDPFLARRIELERDKLLGQAYLARVLAEAYREFDANPAIEAAARERYVIDKAKYSKPESAMITQIKFRFDGAPDVAKARADEAYAMLKAGADMGDLAASVAENPNQAKLRGIYGPLSRADLDAELVPIVFGATKVGEVNPPVRTAKAWTIIRVNGRIPPSTQPFDEVKAGIIERMRDEYATQARDAALAALGGGQKVFVNEEAIEALRTPPPAKN